MNKNQLKEKLQKLGVPDYLYNLDAKGRDDERFCLDFIDGEWQVYFSERGVKTINESFKSEEHACEFILKKLTI